MHLAPPLDTSWIGLADLRQPVFSYLRRFSRDDAEVEDATQEALLRAACYRHKLHDERRLRPWLMRIARNVLRSRRRRDLRAPRSVLEDDDFDVFEGREAIPGDLGEEAHIELGGALVERAAVHGHLERALAALRDDERGLLLAWYGPGAPSARAGRVCEAAPAAKVRAFRARRRLTRALVRRLALDAEMGWSRARWRGEHADGAVAPGDLPDAGGGSAEEAPRAPWRERCATSA